MSTRLPPIPTPTGRQDALMGIRLMRLRVALDGVLLAMEALAFTMNDDSLLNPSAWHDLAGRVPARLQACGELFRDLRTARASPMDAERIARMRTSYDELRRAYEDFASAIDREPATRRIEATVRRIKANSARWAD